MANNIVTINVSRTVAPAPSTLQGTGAFVTNGGTATSNGTLSLLTELADLDDIIGTSKALASLSWATNVVTATTSAPPGDGVVTLEMVAQ